MDGAMKLAELVETSRRVAGTGGRAEKIAPLAGLLRRLAGGGIGAGAAYPFGALRQGRIGLGWAAVREAAPAATASSPSLSLLEVDAAFSRIGAVSGRGSGVERQRLLGELFSRATPEEGDFLARLVLGELRQGAL